MIEPLFFHQDRLFGCYHPATGQDSSKLLVVCPPFFDEYRRSYRALSEFSIACAEKGVHVLRFDFFGTGESQGLLEEATVAGWIEDVCAAIDEGVALSGADQVTLMGVRFAALLAVHVTHQLIDQYLLWDPVVSGAAYLAWLNQVDEGLKQGHLRDAKAQNLKPEDIVYENFHLPDALKTEIAGLRLTGDLSGAGARRVAVTTDPSFCGSGIADDCEFAGFQYDWPAYHDGIITMKPVLEVLARRVLSS